MIVTVPSMGGNISPIAVQLASGSLTQLDVSDDFIAFFGPRARIKFAKLIRFFNAYFRMVRSP